LTHSFKSIPPGTATTIIRSDGHQRLKTKNRTAIERTMAIHSLEPNSVIPRSTLTNAGVKCA